MKNKKYLTEDIPSDVRLKLYRKVLRMLESNPTSNQDKYGYGLCIMLRQVLFNVPYSSSINIRIKEDLAIITGTWFYTSTKYKLKELTDNKIRHIDRQYEDNKVEQRIVVLKEMIIEVKQKLKNNNNNTTDINHD